MSDSTSLFGYVPSLPANIVGAVFFSSCMLAQTGLGYYYREWFVFVSWGIATTLEFLTYVARSVAHKNPKSVNLYEMQLICSIVAPAFIMRGAFYQLSKLVRIYGKRYLKISPKTSVWLFIIADLTSVVFQAAGSAVVAVGIGNADNATANTGRWLVVGGLGFQVAVMIIFLVVWVVVIYKIVRDGHTKWDSEFADNRQRKLYPWFVPSMTLVQILVIIRSIYRIVEVSAHSNSAINTHEFYFLVLDGLMVLLASVLLSVVYPRLAYGIVPVLGSRKADEALPLHEYDR